MERRYCQLEMRAVEQDGKRKLRGYAAVFDSLSVDLWGFREKIAPGTFAASLAAGDDVRALWNHNTDFVLGRTKNGTLSLSEDETGLAFELEPPDTQLARDLVASVERGDVDQMSFGFAALDADWDIDENEQLIRTLRKVKLYEISPVTFPAYPATSVSARAGNDPAYGDIPQIPAEVQRALADAAKPDHSRARAARARLMRLVEGN